MTLLLACFGVVYGIYSLSTLALGFIGIAKHIEQDDADITSKSQGAGLEAFAFRIGRPLYWFLTLPFRSIYSALGLSALLVAPLLIFGSF